MKKARTITILISCPGDVEPEKLEIIRVCKTFTTSNRNKFEITFDLIDWKDHVGTYGKRPQEQLNEYFGDYDVYIGIIWKRFGTKPGSVNSTGKENESGTEEEFYLALDHYNTHKSPQIYFFVKDFDKETKNVKETEQLLKVHNFLEKQKASNLNFINKFKSHEDFNSKIIQLLKDLEYQAIEVTTKGYKRRTKKEIRLRFANLSFPESQDTDVYIKRETLHFDQFQQQAKNPYFDVERLPLDQLIVKKKRIILLGDAGSGKSTELKKLHSGLSHEDSLFVSVFQSLNSYTPNTGLEAFLPEGWKEVPQKVLLIIWDGLDEIEPKDFKTVTRQINSFADKYSEIRILISCRLNFYELPLNGSSGTLSEFEPYVLSDLTLKDAKEYYGKMYSLDKSDNFISAIYDKGLDDLAAKPFFLMLLSDLHNQNTSLEVKRAGLYAEFLLKRVEFDRKHFKETYDLRSRKKEILKLLEKVALGMEMLARNFISEDELLTLISSEEFNSLKYCTAFKKKDGEDAFWQFEHNNIQEYLAAMALSNLSFKEILRFISFPPNQIKLLPSWLNTVSFLFNILEKNSQLFQDILGWLLQNERETLVKFEHDKIQKEDRVQIFQEIFNYYKKHGIWVSSNKFSDKDLAKFGQSKENIQFLIGEIGNKNNSRIIHMDAIRLLGYFQIKEIDMRDKVKTLILEKIDDNPKDQYFIHTAIHSLDAVNVVDDETIKLLIDKLGARKNQHIRSAVYSILSKSNVLDQYVDYIIEGYSLLGKKLKDERDGVTLVDEGWRLDSCIKNLKSSKGLKEIIEFVSGNRNFEHSYNRGEVVQTIIENATILYPKDESIFDTMLNWVRKEINEFNYKTTKQLKSFFDQTDTIELAFHEIWNSKTGERERTKSHVLANFVTENLVLFVMDEYQKHNITNQDLQDLYFDMNWVNNPHKESLLKQIDEKTSLSIERSPSQIDQEKIRLQKLEQDFSMFFDYETFKEATLRIFEKEKKDAFTFDELFEFRKKNYKWVEIDDQYPSAALELLRNFRHPDRIVYKEKVKDWFELFSNQSLTFSL